MQLNAPVQGSIGVGSLANALDAVALENANELMEMNQADAAAAANGDVNDVELVMEEFFEPDDGDDEDPEAEAADEADDNIQHDDDEPPAGDVELSERDQFLVEYLKKEKNKETYEAHVEYFAPASEQAAVQDSVIGKRYALTFLFKEMQLRTKTKNGGRNDVPKSKRIEFQKLDDPEAEKARAKMDLGLAGKNRVEFEERHKLRVKKYFNESGANLQAFRGARLLMFKITRGKVMLSSMQQVEKWKVADTTPKKLGRKRAAGGGKPLECSDVDSTMKTWVSDLIEQRKVITHKMMTAKLLDVDPDIVKKVNWLARFMARHSLAPRRIQHHSMKTEPHICNLTRQFWDQLLQLHCDHPESHSQLG
jgi:hypothetical protein